LSDNFASKYNQLSLFFIIYIFHILIPDNSVSQPDSLILLREDFTNLSGWGNMYIGPKKARTDYQIINFDDNSSLQIKSSNAASGILWNSKFKPHESPILEWRWKVDIIVENADGREKSGDDYAVRIFVLFANDSNEVSFWDEIKNTAFEVAFGYEPPHSGIIFVWASVEQDERFFPSPYGKDLMIWNIRQGKKEINKWVEEKINILECYQQAFKKMPPKIASLAIMGDSDNTGENSLAYIDFIEIRK